MFFHPLAHVQPAPSPPPPTRSRPVNPPFFFHFSFFFSTSLFFDTIATVITINGNYLEDNFQRAQLHFYRTECIDYRRAKASEYYAEYSDFTEPRRRNLISDESNRKGWNVYNWNIFVSMRWRWSPLLFRQWLAPLR